MFLQPVPLPEWSYLEEVLLWVAFQRLPIASYDLDGIEFRDDVKEGGYSPEGDNDLDDDECSRAGIPPDPTYTRLMADQTTLPLEHYDKFLGMPDIEAKFRTQLEAERRQAVEYHRALAEWAPKYERAIEYPASRIFIALREGRLAAFGRLLPDITVEAATELLAKDDKDITDLPMVEIPRAFWSLGGIHWSSNAAQNDRDHYCWIRCTIKNVLSLFPGDHREPVFGVEQVGTTFIVPDGPAKRPLRGVKPRGRPAYPWDQFHLEVADVLSRRELPDKKEAAIQHFQDWFQHVHGKRPSRAAIGEKLKPYYDRFVRLPDRK